MQSSTVLGPGNKEHLNWIDKNTPLSSLPCHLPQVQSYIRNKELEWNKMKWNKDKDPFQTACSKVSG